MTRWAFYHDETNDELGGYDADGPVSAQGDITVLWDNHRVLGRYRVMSIEHHFSTYASDHPSARDRHDIILGVMPIATDTPEEGDGKEGATDAR